LLPAEARLLAFLIKDAARGGAGGAACLNGGGGGPLIALVTPLARRADGDRGVGQAMLALRRAWDGPAFDETMLEHLFGLSPTQALIALALFNGQSPEEIALQRGVKITTLRTHLTEIFLRTGAETQRDLMRLLGTLPPLRKRDAD
jgi:DNA-binding CsgD family transcriptional regulator